MELKTRSAASRLGFVFLHKKDSEKALTARCHQVQIPVADGVREEVKVDDKIKLPCSPSLHSHMFVSCIKQSAGKSVVSRGGKKQAGRSDISLVRQTLCHGVQISAKVACDQ
jgi:hypothetical protein